MSLLVQNSKMKKSSDTETTVINWTIPAFQSSTGLKTCPNAGLCAKGCYARQGAYVWNNVKLAHEAKLALTQIDTFVNIMIDEINKWLSKKSVKNLKVRVHDAGDFYSKEYVSKWFQIMRHFENNKNVSFYAYTKQVEMFKDYQKLTFLPTNFILIYSYGGKQDNLIDPNRDRHSKVFETVKELKQSGYIDASHDDMVAVESVNNKIGLVVHGAKKWENTGWFSKTLKKAI